MELAASSHRPKLGDAPAFFKHMFGMFFSQAGRDDPARTALEFVVNCTHTYL